MKKKVLIIGNSVNAYSLAKKLSDKNEVYAAPGNDGISEFATCVDIRENSAAEILNFVLENSIDITIPISNIALNTNITELFNDNNAKIFAPNRNGLKISQDKAYAKKLLYRLKVPTPKFGIFEKQSMALDYIKNQQIPFVIKTNSSSSAVVLTSTQSAKIIIDSISAEANSKIIIEDYVYGTPFGFYTITDGYKALPLGSSIIYKHSLEGEGGQLTSGMGACSPNYKLSISHEDYLMQKVICPTIAQLENEGNPYLGILGVNGIITDEGDLQILGFHSFMQNCDCAGILEIIDADIISLIDSCIIGSFSDEIDFIPQKDISAVSVALACKREDKSENVINGLDNLDENTILSMGNCVFKNKYMEFETNSGIPLILTSTGRTTSSATEKVYEEIDNISFNGMKYRKDICRSLVLAD